MTRTRTLPYALAGFLTVFVIAAHGNAEKPFGEGWKQVVPVPRPELGEGDQYVVWVEHGWLQARRENAKGITDWHVVLAQATGPEPPIVSAPEGSVRFEVSYRGGRYFVREDANMLRCLRERKPKEPGSWPGLRLSMEGYRAAGEAGSLENPPRLQGWSGDKGFLITSSPGSGKGECDCLVRLSPPLKRAGYGYESLHGSALKRVFYGQNWILDDGDLLIAQRTLETGVLADVEVGDPAPAFEVKSLDGKVLKLADYRGKYVLLDFWATWCAPCVAEMPNLKTVYDSHEKSGKLVIIGLSLDEESEAPRKFVSQRNIPWLQACLGDPSESPVTKSYGIQEIPATFLIGPDGKVIAKGMRGKQLREGVSHALEQDRHETRVDPASR